MDKLGNDAKLTRLELELERIKTHDLRLIKKKQLYKDRLKIAVREKRVDNQEANFLMRKFEKEYGDLRLKCGQRWISILDEKVELIGKPRSIKVDDSVLDGMMKV